MIDNVLVVAMTDEDFLQGETRHQEAEQSRKLAMAAGLSKSSEEFKQTWVKDPDFCLMALKALLHPSKRTRT